MNTPNNKRSITSQENIESAFIELMATHNIRKITIQSICNLANVNRSTFYAHYSDIYDLQSKIEEKLSKQMTEIFEEAMHDKNKMKTALCEMSCFIKNHKDFYKLLLKYNNLSILSTILKNSDFNRDNNITEYYQISFFTAGVSAIIRIWLNNDCKEKSEELLQIIYR